MQNPLLFPLVAVATGVLLARLAALTPAESLWPAVALATVSVLAWRFASRRAALAALFACLVFAGAWVAAAHRPGPAPQLNAESGESLLLAGCVVEPPAIHADREQFLLELAEGARARITLRGTGANLRYGQQVELAARVRYPRNFRNPGAFNYIGYLSRRDIYWTASADAADVEVLAGECGSRFRAAVYGMRTAALDRLADLYRGDAYKTGVMQALLVGDSTHVERLWTEHFRRTGTYHALVISGLHISVLAGTILLLTRLCFLPMNVALPFAAATVWLYALVAGGAAPVTRSAAGFTLFLLGKWFYRRGRILNILAAVGLVFLIADPEQLFEASFQLSFLSVAAIGAVAAPLIENTSHVLVRASRSLADTRRDVHLEPRVASARVELRLLAETLELLTRLPLRHAARLTTASVRLAAFVFDSAVISVCVQIGLALPMIFYFHRMSVSATSANIAVVPLLNTAVQAGFLAMLTGWQWLAAIAGTLLDAARWVVDAHAALEPNWRIPDPPLWLALALAGSLAATLVLRRRRSYAAVASLALLTLSCAYTPRQPAPRTLELTAIDVGQGDCLFLRFPDGTKMLVDGGGIPAFGKNKRPPALDIGEDVVSPYLWRRGLRAVDVIVSTHAHEDHAGGLRALAANFAPREVWAGASPEPVPVDAGIAPVRRLRAGSPFPFGGATVQVLAPAPSYASGAKAANNDSLVLLITYGGHRFLLTGDIDQSVEWEMLEGGRLPRLDVLKVAHHGSRTSSAPEFLDAAQPRLAVLSSGVGNLYRLPHPEVVDRFAARRIPLLRTDALGLCTVVSDGQRLSFTSEQWDGGMPSRYTVF